MGIKRLVGLVVVLAVVLGAIIYFRNRAAVDKGKIHVLTWSNYFPEASLKDFTAKTGIKVELSYMSSNEELFAKLKAGATGFDIIQPSDYMVRRMTRLEMLQPLNHAQLPNLRHIDDYYRNPSYDPGMKMSVPFTWGTTGIAVDTSKVKLPAEVSWKLLYETPDPRHTSLLDDMREVFAGVLKLRGHSINSSDKAVLLSAKNEIAKLKPRILTFASEPKPLLLRGEVSIAHIFSVDAIQAGIENPNWKYFIPVEGGTIWTDNFSIPRSSPRSNEAHLFIDYFLDPNNAVVILKENHLATPNKAARLLLDPKERDDVSLYPPKEVLDKMQFLEDMDDVLPEMNRMWTELKS